MNYLYEPRMAGNTDLYSPKSLEQVGLAETDFHRMISLERRRNIRSQRTFLLMLLDAQSFSSTTERNFCLKKILSVMPHIVRETDVFGWYKANSVIGVMFTEIIFDGGSVPATMKLRVHEVLNRFLNAGQFQQVGISFHFLPEAGPRDASPSYAEVGVRAPLVASAVQSSL